MPKTSEADECEVFGWSESGLSRLEIEHGPAPGYRVTISWSGPFEKAQLIADYIRSLDPVIDGSISPDSFWKL